MREIRVTGIGQKNYPVDEIVLTITTEIIDKSYEVVLEKEKETYEFLSTQLRDSLKTIQYRIDPAYESVETNGRYQQIFVGYRLTHQMMVRMPLNLERLGQMIDEISKAPHQPMFHIEYEAKNIDEDELLILAVHDGQRKAKVLASAAKVTLDQLTLVSTSTQPVLEHRMMKFSSSADQLEFSDVTKSLSVEMVWEIR